MNRYDGRFIDFTLSKDCKHRAYSVIISTRIFNNSCGVCMLEYSCETPRFSHLMTHDSNCCLLDDPWKSLNWKNKIHITSLFFLAWLIDHACFPCESKIHPSGSSKCSQNIGGDFKYALNQVSWFVGGVPKFLSVLKRLEAIREKFQSVIAVLK